MGFPYFVKRESMYIPYKKPRIHYFSLNFDLRYMGFSYTGIPFYLEGPAPSYDIA